MSEPLWAAAGIGFLVLTFWYAHAPTPSIAGDVPVETHTHFHGWRGVSDADGTYRVFDERDHLAAAFHVRDNRVSEVPLPRSTEPGARTYRSSYDRDFYLGQRDLDFGAWTGYARTGSAPHWQTGVRYAPYRFLYDAVSADLACSPDVAGAGISVFPPADFLGDFWSHIGLGVWYVAPFDGGSPGFVYGVSFSTH
jgi:hypothetical protein